jgi:metacaspase-1
MLVKPMKAGVHVTVLMDCCHSGTALDLPYRFSADDSQMRINQSFSMDGLMDVQTVLCCACMAMMLADMLMGGD